MAFQQRSGLTSMRRSVAATLTGPPALAFLPALTLAAFWFGGEVALVLAAALLPILYLVGNRLGGGLMLPRDAVSGLFQRSAFEELTEQVYQRAKVKGRHTAAFFIAIEDLVQLTDRHGQSAADIVVQRTGERLVTALRGDDNVGQMGDARFAICMDPVRQLDLELCIQLAGRLQAAVEEPVSIDGVAIYLTASVGFCLNTRAPGDDGAAWLRAAATALRAAQRRGPSSIRAFSDQMRRDTENRAELREEVVQALDNGQIQPWFQPQNFHRHRADHRV